MLLGPAYEIYTVDLRGNILVYSADQAKSNFIKFRLLRSNGFCGYPTRPTITDLW